MLKLVLMLPQNDLQRQWAPRLQRSLPDYRVVVPETEAEACHELIDANAAYGWVPSDALPAATRLRWLQNPQQAAENRGADGGQQSRGSPV